MAFGGENAESYYDEGVTLAMKGDVNRAITYFSKAIHMDNGMAAAYHQLAKCYQRMGDFDKAIQLLQQVVSARPDSIPPLIDMGYSQVRGGYTKAARDTFSKVAALEPQKGRGQLGMAEVYFSEGDWAAAAASAQESIALGGSGFAALFLLGRAARLSGDSVLSNNTLDKADKLAERSVESNPNGPEGHYLRGEVQFARENFADALEYFRKAEETADAERVYSAYGINFALPDTICKQGLCYQRLGQNERTRECGARALGLDGEHSLAKALSQVES